MNRKAWAYAASSLLILGAISVAVVFAGTSMPEVMDIHTPYEKTRNTIQFTHQKHIDDYSIGCGDCHHDEQGRPLTDLKPGDEVQTCFECHNQPGEVKGKEAKEMSDKEKLAYHANAVHENCIGCHRDYNREHKKKLAPQTCSDCHPK